MWRIRAGTLWEYYMTIVNNIEKYLLNQGSWTDRGESTFTKTKIFCLLVIILVEKFYILTWKKTRLNENGIVYSDYNLFLHSVILFYLFVFCLPNTNLTLSIVNYFTELLQLFLISLIYKIHEILLSQSRHPLMSRIIIVITKLHTIQYKLNNKIIGY